MCWCDFFWNRYLFLSENVISVFRKLKKVLFSPCDNCKDYVCLIGDLLLASNLRKQHLLIIKYVTLQNCWNHFRSYLVNLCAPKDTLASNKFSFTSSVERSFFFSFRMWSWSSWLQRSQSILSWGGHEGTLSCYLRPV